MGQVRQKIAKLESRVDFAKKRSSLLESTSPIITQEILSLPI